MSALGFWPELLASVRRLDGVAALVFDVIHGCVGTVEKGLDSFATIFTGESEADRDPDGQRSGGSVERLVGD